MRLAFFDGSCLDVLFAALVWCPLVYSSTIFSFIFASRLPRYFNPTFANFWHPLLTTYISATVWFLGYGAMKGKSLLDVLGEYLKTGGLWNFIMFFLEPAIISFAFGLYERRVLLVQNAAAIIGGSFTAAFVGIFLMAGLARAFNPSRTIKLALLPRATAALAIVQAGMIGASTALTTVNCCLTGIAGANFGPKLLDLFGQRDPIARGVATGGAGLALASAALALNDPLSFPFGALSMAITSTFATLLFSIPQVIHLTLSASFAQLPSSSPA
ncbi:hypothetical protein GUITHDRAFT_111530 [Guillardia theta CCMP2712]|uniref:LrgB-like protein n=1 Tax=Guillardia theta (strain CCMP2712) TaxID=905079 RepID=L1J383_GUITC|nr:hypothetical protein GUITHDRAFT_111530 [Guillardia theta CCMP2712]EKX42555.1 hypothetical protein GUITHDRAFT_111530 [Guillardia theta CCMP2712]|eukprot:XP_005829535.1 hypothetical protein GUITHDRAFT_111530 [Guillardia theta CCMP2712]